MFLLECVCVYVSEGVDHLSLHPHEVFLPEQAVFPIESLHGIFVKKLPNLCAVVEQVKHQKNMILLFKVMANQTLKYAPK